MKVSELIKELQGLPENAQVFVIVDDEWKSIKKVDVNEDGDQVFISL